MVWVVLQVLWPAGRSASWWSSCRQWRLFVFRLLLLVSSSWEIKEKEEYKQQSRICRTTDRVGMKNENKSLFIYFCSKFIDHKNQGPFQMGPRRQSCRTWVDVGNSWRGRGPVCTGLNWQGREADCSHQSSVEVKNGGAMPPLLHTPSLHSA
jgi:hypothetical protein